jgi:glutamate dehydrogenase (NADP+)
MNVNKIIAGLQSKYPGEKEYLQAVREVLETIEDVVEDNAEFATNGVIERLIEPDKVLIFKVPWVDDKGSTQINTGYRVQFNNALGPYKGGLRFHPSVNLSIMKFLAFEQIFKNSLTSLPMGGAKGGSDFNPKGKSNTEIMRFCQAFMLGLWKHIGPNTDIPAGDIGVSTREIGYMYAMYKKLTEENTGVLTGKGLNWGGSRIRPEATGYGAVYFTMEMLKSKDIDIAGKRVAVSGFGNVAWGVVKKINELGGKVITISGPDGTIYDEEGISGEKIDFMLELRASNKDIVSPFAFEFESAKFYQKRKPWSIPCDIAIPCATQNELDEGDAKDLVKNNCICVTEGANMPCTPEAIRVFKDNQLLYAPGKAANAGGVATSGLEMSQNAMKLSWTADEVDEHLKNIMKHIHDDCVKYGTDLNGNVDYVKGANIAGFLKVADAMVDMGVL